MGAGYKFQARKQDDTAEIQIYEDVGGSWFGGVTAKQIAGDLRSVGKTQPLHVRISSYGGDVAEGMAIYRLVAEHSGRKTVHIDGVAASIASVIAMAGDDIVIAESASMMIHDAWTIHGGNADEFEAKVRELRSISGQMADLYAARTKQSPETIKAWMRETKWFYGKEAVDAGFATEMAANVTAVASGSLWLSHMHGRIASGINTQRITAAPHPGNADVRAELQAVTERMRARAALAKSRGSGS